MGAAEQRASAADSRSVDDTRVARYVAIITDGNGRWARARGVPINEGHSAGADTVKARLRDAAELGRVTQPGLDGVGARFVSRDHRQPAPLRPTAVPVGDDGDVPSPSTRAAGLRRLGRLLLSG
jgi:hypothetical protein